MATKQVTRVAVVVDKSGSMSSVKSAALSGLNEQLQTLRMNADKGGETYVTLIQFNTSVDVSFDQKIASALTDLTDADYTPTGGTALRDGVLTAINRLQSMTEEKGTEVAYLVVIISDGEENSSRLISQKDLAEKIQTLQASERWTFTYMLSNTDLSKIREMGVHAQNVTAYTSDFAGTRSGFARMASSTANYMTTRSRGLTSVANFYDENVTLTTPLAVSGSLLTSKP